MKKIVVLGAGMVGRAMAIDLAKTFAVTSVDASDASLEYLKQEKNISTLKADLSNASSIKKVIAKADVVVGAVPGFMGFEICKTVVEAKKNLVDISFFPEDALQLNALAKKNNVTAVVDCGVAPGMDNMILGYHMQHMDVTDFTCMVGGLPVKRTLPFQYKAPFSPIDVIEEYIRPARLVENGEIVVKPALSEPELVEFENIGTLEAFNTDGLRSLVKTMRVKNMREKTLRYVGHREIIQSLKDAGMFSEENILVNGVSIKPLHVTAKVLLPQWKLLPRENEFTVMRIIVSGKENGRKKTYTYDLLDYYNATTNTSSMARTTGYTCTAVVHLLANNLFKRKGIIPPEYVSANESCFHFVVNYLKQRGVIYNCKIS